MVSTPRKTIIDQKPKTPMSPERDRPGKQEGHFEVEDDEQDRRPGRSARRTSCAHRRRRGSRIHRRTAFRDRAWRAPRQRHHDQRAAQNGREPEEDQDRQIFQQQILPYAYPMVRAPAPMMTAAQPVGPVSISRCSIEKPCHRATRGLKEDSRQKNRKIRRFATHAKKAVETALLLRTVLKNGAIFREKMAGATGLEPATFGVTGRHSNQLSYAPAAIPICGARRGPM